MNSPVFIKPNRPAIGQYQSAFLPLDKVTPYGVCIVAIKSRAGFNRLADILEHIGLFII
jgi:hypothetical protein